MRKNHHHNLVVLNAAHRKMSDPKLQSWKHFEYSYLPSVTRSCTLACLHTGVTDWQCTLRTVCKIRTRCNRAELTLYSMLNVLVHCIIPGEDDVLWEELLYTQRLRRRIRSTNIWEERNGRTDNRSKDEWRQKQQNTQYDVNQKVCDDFLLSFVFLKQEWKQDELKSTLQSLSGSVGRGEGGGIKVGGCLCGLNNFRHCPKTKRRKRFSCWKTRSILFKSG
jgi:hypothetical protein